MRTATQPIPSGFDKPHRFPLIVEPANRDETTAKDAKLVNGFIERVKTGSGVETYIYERAGLTQQSQPSGGAALGLGIYNWKNDIYTVFGSKLYKNGVAITGTVDTTGGIYHFSQNLGAIPMLQLGNGVKAYNYDDTNGLVQITSANFPTAFVKGWAYLDGTTYVMTAAPSIDGSNINDTITWTAGNNIVPQIEADSGIVLRKQLIYVAAFKQWTTEFFFDAENLTGTPLAPAQNLKVNLGCLHADGIQEIDGVFIWPSTNRSGSVQVAAMQTPGTVEIISNKAVERLLDQIDYTTIYSWQLKHDGHKFYGLTSKVSNLTLVYDLTENMWAQWTDKDGNYFPIVGSTFTSTLAHLFQHETNGKVYTADMTAATDDGDIITVDIYTPNWDGGIRKRKQMSLLSVIGDRKAGSILLERHNDYDYDPTKWTNFRHLDMNKQRPFLTNCGTFERRAENFRHACPVRMPRLQAVEVQLDIGTL